MSTSATSEREAVTSTSAPNSGGASGSLEQVRELLFGAQLRDFERRLMRVDAHLASEAEELRKEMRRRIEVLETHVQRESEELIARFEAERADQAEAVANVGREWRATTAMLEQRINKLVEALAHAQRELRQQLLDQSKAFLDETQRTRDELFATVTRELGPEGEPPVRERGFDEETGAPSHH